jgi:hypothetical protein
LQRNARSCSFGPSDATMDVRLRSVRVNSFCQLQNFARIEFQAAGSDAIKNRGGTFNQFLPGARVVLEESAGYMQRTQSYPALYCKYSIHRSRADARLHATHRVRQSRSDGYCRVRRSLPSGVASERLTLLEAVRPDSGTCSSRANRLAQQASLCAHDWKSTRRPGRPSFRHQSDRCRAHG